MAPTGLLKKAATYADLERVPPHQVAEILDGELYATPRPAVHHAHATSVLGVEIGGAYHRGRGGPGGWWILDEPELHLGDNVVVPDLAGWRRSRLPALPDTPALSVAPDWVCEMISPSTESIDRGKKLAIYARERVQHLWLVNPASQVLEVMSLGEGRWILVATYVAGALVRAEPFDAIELDLSALWPS